MDNISSTLDIPQNHVQLAREFIEIVSKSDGLEVTTDELDSFVLNYKNNDIKKSFEKKDWAYKHKCLKQAAISLGVKLEFKGLEEVKLKELTKKYMKQFIQLEECNISTIAPNRPVIEKMTYVCRGCNEERSRPPKKGEHDDCSINDWVKNPNPEDVIDAQWLRIQETQHDSSMNKIPVTLPVLVKGEDMLWKLSFNERIKAKGILRYRIVKNKMGDDELAPWFEMLEYDKTLGLDEEIELSDKEIEDIKKEMEKPGYWNKLIKSFCPWIYGQEVMKEMTLLGMGSMKTEMPLRMLFVGDPGTGKSDILKAANMLPAQKHYAIMKQSRGTGLTVTSVKDPDTDQWTVEGGEFVYANEWCLIIDEFQAGEEKDISGLNAVIWDHELPYNLAGGVRGVFKTKCALIFACNPHTGRLAKEENIFILLKFIGEKALPAFITGMTFILYSEEEKGQDFDANVGKKIYENWSVERKKKHFWEDWFDESEMV